MEFTEDESKAIERYAESLGKTPEEYIRESTEMLRKRICTMVRIGGSKAFAEELMKALAADPDYFENALEDPTMTLRRLAEALLSKDTEKELPQTIQKILQDYSEGRIEYRIAVSKLKMALFDA